MTELQKQLCSRLQVGLPICKKPFKAVAEELGTDEQVVMQQVAQLKKQGIIRRLNAVINHRALGRASTLATSHVPDEQLKHVAEAVNALEGVSHNYQRGHYYNLWFTLQGKDEAEIEQILASLGGRFSLKFHSLPVVREFKLQVIFDAGQQQKRPEKVLQQLGRAVELDAQEKAILSKLQGELEIVTEPFAGMASAEISSEQVLRIIEGLVGKGVIRRISAVVNHRRLGFVENVLFVCEMPAERLERAGRKLAEFEIVSHCYQRRIFTGWEYNLFAMMHGRTRQEIQSVLDEFVESERPVKFALLPSVAEFKKQPVRYRFE